MRERERGGGEGGRENVKICCQVRFCCGRVTGFINVAGPDIVAFITKKDSHLVSKSGKQETKEVMEVVDEDQERVASEECVVISHVATDKRWLHMDVVEKEKMEWMKDVPVIKQPPKVC